MDKTLTYYLCGPMSGLPQFNVPLFNEVSARLRNIGFTIVSPAELDSPEMRAAALLSPDGKMGADGKLAGETWGDVLARDVRLIEQTIDGIIVLPNWYKSRGARLEVFVGLLTGKRFATYDPFTEWLAPFPVDDVRADLRDNMP